jgi:hypothetical protein
VYGFRVMMILGAVLAFASAVSALARIGRTASSP